MAVVGATILFAGCQWLMENSGPVPIVVRSDRIILSWDSEGPAISGDVGVAVQYNVYYRSYGTLHWNYLHSTGDGETVTEISHTELEHGDYEFAVEKMRTNDETSDLHASSDFTAWPPGGWYVIWEAP